MPAFSRTPWSNSFTVPFLTVTPSKPSLRTPAPSPVPSITCPLRSTVMLWAPMTSPSRQSVRSLPTVMLLVTTSPQLTGSPGGGGGAEIVQRCSAGVGSVFPARSVARTRKTWSPAAGPSYVRGETHSSKAEPSSEQVKVECRSLDENLNVAVVSVVGLLGPELIVVCGGVVSPPVGGP
jgi:hypothetical protein